MTGLPTGVPERILRALPTEPPGLTEGGLVKGGRGPVFSGALRWLLHSGYVAREGAGAKRDPFRYWRMAW